MKFKKGIENDEKAMIEFLETQIGRTFKVTESLAYPHGRMQTHKLIAVKKPVGGLCCGTAEFEATFPDGYKANYCTSVSGFFDMYKNQF